MIRLREEEFSDIVNYMREAYGINLDKKKVLIECRMTKLLEKKGTKFIWEIPGYAPSGQDRRYGRGNGQLPDDKLYLFL